LAAHCKVLCVADVIIEPFDFDFVVFDLFLSFHNAAFQLLNNIVGLELLG